MCAPLRIADLLPESFARLVLATVNVTTVQNQPPTVSFISPAANAVSVEPGSFTLTANATSAGSSIAKVDFYNGTTLLGTATVAPYTFAWSNVPAGSYSITAKATDNTNATTTSAPVSVTVNAAASSVQAYYIHTDHLDTPRLITDTAGNTVWQWDNVDPFGNNMANENPSGIGAFRFNLRFPGQYFDRETNTHYNINRDYDPSIGRYIQSDPIGLNGGSWSTYTYVNGNPISYTDPLGLKTYRCTKPLNALTDKFGSGVSKWAGENLPAAYHQYSCVVDNKGKVTCGGQDHTGSAIRSPGKPSDDRKDAGQCKQTEPDNKCFEQCLKDEWAKPRPTYGIPFGTDCQEYDDEVNERCRKQCKK